MKAERVTAGRYSPPGQIVSTAYNRERALQSRFNAFIEAQPRLPPEDYYSRLDQQSLGELKSIVSIVNNILTLKLCLQFVDWLGETLSLGSSVVGNLKHSILRTSPNANGYDLEITEPVAIIAEVKCNVPINRSRVYGSGQRTGIAKDVNSLVCGKKKSKMNPDSCLKFMVLLDTPEIRNATSRFVKNMKEHKDTIIFSEPGIKPERKDRVYVVFLSRNA
jgi:hypothetical protein